MSCSVREGTECVRARAYAVERHRCVGINRKRAHGVGQVRPLTRDVIGGLQDACFPAHFQLAGRNLDAQAGRKVAEVPEHGRAVPAGRQNLVAIGRTNRLG